MAATDYADRWIGQRGKRPVRIANCSGYKGKSSLFPVGLNAEERVSAVKAISPQHLSIVCEH
jgi:hypothetical protein